jgi:predicted DNA-binding protein (MmcQ/YjbR family)
MRAQALFSGPTYRKYKKLFLSHPGAVETYPFGPEVAVYKNRAGKIFALLSREGDDWFVNLKCDPHWALTLRRQHPAVIEPGYHMNKKHWNTVSLAGSLSPALVRKMAELSYLLVTPSASK